MKQTHRRRWRRLLQGLCLYGLLCGFFWAYLTVQTRSQNRMTHTPAAMAQLTIQPNQTASLCLAAQEYRWKLPRLDSQWLWLAALPDTAGTALAAADRLVRDHCVSRFSENFL